MNMNAKVRLETLQAKLVERGVRDVKFFFTLSDSASLSSVASDVADVLEAVEAGRYVPMGELGDSVRA
jgi:hypothetical protein